MLTFCCPMSCLILSCWKFYVENKDIFLLAQMIVKNHILSLYSFSTEAEAPPIPKRSRSTPSRFCKRGRIGAPLASTETLSPSLASSFCSDIIFFDDQSSCHGDMDESSYSQVPSLYLQPSPVPSHSGGHSVWFAIVVASLATVHLHHIPLLSLIF